MSTLSVAVVMTRPTQIEAPLFREIVRTSPIDLEVYYLDMDGITTGVDSELGFSPDWNINLTEGYKSVCCPPAFLARLRFLKRRCFAGCKYDLVIVPGYARLDLALLALRYWDQPLGMRLDTVSIYPEPPWKSVVKRMVLKQLFRRYAVFHPIGSLTGAFLRELGIEPARMFRFPYAVDNHYLRTRAEGFRVNRARLLSELRILPEDFVILGVLKFIPRENPSELVRGFRLFHERHPQSALILVGAGPLEEELRGLIKEAGLTETVRLVGFAKYSDLPRWYAVSDVFVHPAKQECWGVSVNEAMACGLPVVASDQVGSAYDLVREGLNGYRYPSGDCEALSRCLEKIACGSDRLRMAQEAQSAVAEWGYKASIASIVAALKKVTGKTHADLPVADELVVS